MSFAYIHNPSPAQPGRSHDDCADLAALILGAPPMPIEYAPDPDALAWVLFQFDGAPRSEAIRLLWRVQWALVAMVIARRMSVPVPSCPLP